tara:strand:+ start:946 stop:2364 length:1419 start_codon:yes stop_codon:yes gene_type:complete
MKFKLSQILESNILLEGRKEDVIKKYGEEHTELIQLLSGVDPSGNNKYLDWMVKTSLGKNDDTQVPPSDMVARVVDNFHKQLARIKNKDINSYKNLNDLEAAVDIALQKEKEKLVSKQAKKVFEDEDIVIYAPMTVEASCKYGAGSQWCIASTTGANNTNNHFDDYSRHSNFYFLINKNMNRAQNPRDYKYALQYKMNDGNMTWWDANDNSSSNKPSWLSKKALDSIIAFDPKHKKIKLGAQLQAYLDAPSTNKYVTFRDVMTPQQKSVVIKKLLSLPKFNSSDFKHLVVDLNDSQKDEIISRTKDSVTAQDLTALKPSLNLSQMLGILQRNSGILNNYTVMTELSDLFSDEQKFELSKVMDGKKINNTDSKVLFKKWSMTPEERKKHGMSSFYVFLSSPDKHIESLTKVDPLDPESYRKINMMKLRKEVQKNTEINGIKTEANLLDDYIGTDLGDIPIEITELLKNKSRKI